MKKGKLILGLLLILIGMVDLAAILLCGAKHQFFFFLTFVGLGYALVDEALTESKSKSTNA